MTNPPIPEFNYKVNKDSTGQFREHIARLTHWGNQGWTRVAELELACRYESDVAGQAIQQMNHYKEVLEKIADTDPDDLRVFHDIANLALKP